MAHLVKNRFRNNFPAVRIDICIVLNYNFCMIFSISDLHLSSVVDKPMDIFGGGWVDYWDVIREDWRKRVGADDIVLLCGDLSWGMKLSEALPDLAEIGELPGKKIIIRGNHDLWWSSYSQVLSALPENMFALQNNCLRFGDKLFCGTRGWTVASETTEEADRKINAREQIRLGLSLDAAAAQKKEGDVLVLMLHYPPFNAAFDNSEFTEIIKKYPVDYVLYGHLHGKNCRTKPVVTKDGIPYLLTSCDLVGNKLVEICK